MAKNFNVSTVGKEVNAKTAAGHRSASTVGKEVYAKTAVGPQICEHGRQRSQCKDCGGSQICEHGRIRSTCKDCGGSQICEHGRIISTCKDCGGSQICEHGRQRSLCKDCGGSQICEHGRIRSTCKDCGGSQICEHGRIRSLCKDCGGSQICEHGRQRSLCKNCGGSQICEHGRQRLSCINCLSMQQIIQNKYKCNACGKSLSRNRYSNNIGLCAHCDRTVRERTEYVARRLLLAQMPPPYDLEKHWSALDSQLIGGQACNTARRRPDAMLVLEDRILGFEIDENSHSDRSLSCELAKLDDHRWGAGDDAKPAVCIRLNPDQRSKDDSSLKEKCIQAAEQLLYYSACPLEKLHRLGTVVVYVGYGRNGRKHIEEARKYPHFRVQEIDCK